MGDVFHMKRADVEATLVQWAEGNAREAAKFYAEEAVFPPTTAGLKARLATVDDEGLAALMWSGFGVGLKPLGGGLFDQTD